MKAVVDFNPLDFSGKKILITGASSGIGRATAVYLSHLGARIVAVGRNKERINETLNSLSGRAHIGLQYDLTEDGSIECIYNDAIEDGYKLDGMVHCAGIAPIRPLKSINVGFLNEIMETNFYTFIELVKIYAKKKYNSGGSIVAVSSLAGCEGELCQTAYAASKAAVNAAMRPLAIELAPKNIRINAVLPGMVRTHMLNESVKEGTFDINGLGTKYILGIAEPEQIAAPIAFLLSDMSSFITGRCMYVDGGRFL